MQIPEKSVRSWVSYLLIAAICIACASPEREESAGVYMLPQASGAELGMRWKAFRQARPRAIRDSYAVWESVGNSASNAYYFAPNRRALQPGSTQGALSAVVMEQALPAADSLLYRARIEEISSSWQAATGVAFRAVGTESTGVIRRTWHLRDVALELEYHTRPSPSGRGWRLRAVVRYPDVQLAVAEGSPPE